MVKVPTVKKLVYAPPNAWLKHKRCQATVLESTQRWRTAAGRDNKCELGALYSVNGQYLCKRHAGTLLIELLLKGEEVIK